MPGSEHITREEAAAIFGVSYATYGKRMQRGQAPRAIAGTRRWSRAAVERAAIHGMAPANSPPPAIDKWAEWERTHA